MNKKESINVIIPHGYKPPKKDIETAWILANYYKTTVYVLQPVNRYRIKTPDYVFNGKSYELKTLTSSQIRQLLTVLSEAKKQSANIIIDIRKTKITTRHATDICSKFIMKHNKCHVALIVSAKQIIDVKI